jgi:hypothetical protein
LRPEFLVKAEQPVVPSLTLSLCGSITFKRIPIIQSVFDLREAILKANQILDLTRADAF